MYTREKKDTKLKKKPPRTLLVCSAELCYMVKAKRYMGTNLNSFSLELQH